MLCCKYTQHDKWRNMTFVENAVPGSVGCLIDVDVYVLVCNGGACINASHPGKSPYICIFGRPWRKGWVLVRVQSQIRPLSFACRILCGACGLWRIIAYEAVLAVRDDAEWTCAQLRCDTLCSVCRQSPGKHAA